MTRSSLNSDVTVQVRFSAEEMSDLDAWIAERPQAALSRSGAIKELLSKAIRLEREWELAKLAAAEGVQVDRQRSDKV
jgi:hypothetical protein